VGWFLPAIGLPIKEFDVAQTVTRIY
jgi:hypothetical protein